MQTRSLNGLWDFVFLGAVDIDSVKLSELKAFEKMPVPSAFDALPIHAGKRGVAIYRTHFNLTSGHAGRLEFGAVSMWCRIFVDGQFLDEHACGYAPFTVTVPPSDQSQRELVVWVDNRFDFARVPMHEEYFDFYQYGGILRDVTLRQLPARGAFIDAVQVTPLENYRDGEVRVSILSGGELSGPLVFTLQFDEGKEVRHEIPVTSGSPVQIVCQVPNPRVWSPESPHLHALRVTLLGVEGKRVEESFVRFGLRRIEAREGALWLNGQKLQLRGYNRHEWHPNFGPCTPRLQMVADLQLMKDLGCNFIRGSHYPQDQGFLDLCDELGFLVWEENLGWGQREKTFASQKFLRDHDRSLRAMVRASFNHPSVVIWGFCNEAGTNKDYTRSFFEETVKTLRSLDPSRLVSYATMFANEDKHFDLIDLISVNIYPGWYGCEGVERPLELIAPFINECLERMDAAGWKKKPVIISEIGAEALYGWREAHNDFFTEEYQAEYLRRACESALAHPRCSGIALWHFSDVRTYSGGWSLKRPRTFNNKGTLDEYRRPKAAYQAVRRVFRALESNT